MDRFGGIHEGLTPCPHAPKRLWLPFTSFILGKGDDLLQGRQVELHCFAQQLKLSQLLTNHVSLHHPYSSLEIALIGNDRTHRHDRVVVQHLEGIP